MATEKSLYDQRITDLERKLERSRNDLDRYKKERDEFIYIASHDLKAPLRKLTIFTERLREKSGEHLNEEALSYLKRIEKNVSSMQSLIDGLSELSEIETNVHFEKHDLHKIIHEVLKESETLLKKNDASVHSSTLPTLDCDVFLLKKVFKNIIDNSVKFQPEGQAAQINITSDLLKVEEKINFNLPVEETYYKIKFADNGIGFNEEDATRILKPFERLNDRSAYPGNGLGLAICNKIIKMHHGIFYAKAPKNAGSLFVLILPAIPQ
jgi:light-regulated signal transduction histidine kinase (bacteriophytochrome)